MARLLGPDANGRLVYVAAGGVLRSAAGREATVYAAASGSTLADIAEYDGTGTPGDVIDDSVLTVDDDSLLPLFWFPDGSDTVYVSVNGGTRVAVNADYDARLDALGTSTVAALAAHADDTTAVHGITDTTALALDDEVLHVSGDESATGLKTFDEVDVTTRLQAAGFALPLVAPSTRPPLWAVASSIVSLFQSSHGWSTSGTPGSSELNDTDTFVRGTQSARLTSNGSGTACGLQRTGMSAMDLTGKAIRLLFRIDDPSRIGNLIFFVGTSTMSNWFRWRFDAETADSKIALAGDWVTVTLQWSELNGAGGSFSISSAGVPSATSGFTDMRFEISDNSTGALTLNLQAVEVIDAPTTAYPNGVVSIVFDDSNDSPELLGRPKMDELGFRGTQYTVADSIGQDTFLTLAQLRSLQNTSGWEIAGHAYTATAHNSRYPNLTAEQVDDDLRNLRAWLVTNGFHGDSFAYPGGQYENTTDGVPVDQLVARYFGSGRTILSSVGVATHTAIDCVPPAMPYRLRGMSSVSSLATGPNKPSNLVAEGGMLDKVAENGGWLTLVFHRVVSGTATDATQVSQTDFESIMDEIADREMTVLPVSEVMQRAGAS